RGGQPAVRARIAVGRADRAERADPGAVRAVVRGAGADRRDGAAAGARAAGGAGARGAAQPRADAPGGEHAGHGARAGAGGGAPLTPARMHRVQNRLATVSARPTLTARHSSAEDFPAALSGRMRALQRATELLAVGENASCDLGRLVEHALAPFRAAGNFRVE